MKHKVACMDCGATERIVVEAGKPVTCGWQYYGVFNMHACKTSKTLLKLKQPDRGFTESNLQRVPNPCYDATVKPKRVELWSCPKCSHKEAQESNAGTRDNE